MLNDRDKKYDSEEESEYHFSDDELHDEVDAELGASTPKVTGGKSSGFSQKLTQLMRSKRMLISVGVFAVLVFIAYKMVIPSTSTPSTNIVASAPVPAAQMQPSVASTNVAGTSVPSQIASSAAQPVPTSQPVIQQPVNPPSMQMQPPSQGPSSMPAEMQPTMTAQPSAVPAAQQPIATSYQPPEQPGTMASPTPPQQSMQNNTAATVMPVPSAMPTPNQAIATQAAQPTDQMLPQQGGQSSIASLAADREHLLAQLQAEYSQRINDYAEQNKALQNQVDMLNARLQTMETQMNQMMQAVTSHSNNQAPNQPPSTANEPTTAEPMSDEGAHVSYNVQAIIPGRAWLRSASGDTVTVAEGDSVKDLGRVTKIDPYDGVVEISTGKKTISLSYGMSG